MNELKADFIDQIFVNELSSAEHRLQWGLSIIYTLPLFWFQRGQIGLNFNISNLKFSWLCLRTINDEIAFAYHNESPNERIRTPPVFQQLNVHSFGITKKVTTVHRYLPDSCFCQTGAVWFYLDQYLLNDPISRKRLIGGRKLDISFAFHPSMSSTKYGRS